MNYSPSNSQTEINKNQKMNNQTQVDNKINQSQISNQNMTNNNVNDNENKDNNITNPINNPSIESLSTEEKNKIQKEEQDTTNNPPHQTIPPNQTSSQVPPKEPKTIQKTNNPINEDMFQKIKDKLEEDYSLSNSGWSDDELMKKILDNLSDELKEKIGKDDDEVIVKISELIGEELLEM